MENLEKIEKLIQEKIKPVNHQSVVIRSQEDFEAVNNNLALSKQAKRTIQDGKFFGELSLNEMIDNANKQHKGLTAFKARLLKPYDDYIRIGGQACSDWFSEQKRLESIKIEEANKKARELEEKEKERLLNQAIKAEEKGKNEKAEELLEKIDSVFVPTPIIHTIEKSIQTENGKTSFIRDLNIAIYNPREVLQAILNNDLPFSCIEFQEGKIKKHISQYDQSDDISKLPAKFFKMGLSISRKYRDSTRTSKEVA